MIVFVCLYSNNCYIRYMTFVTNVYFLISSILIYIEIINNIYKRDCCLHFISGNWLLIKDYTTLVANLARSK